MKRISIILLLTLLKGDIFILDKNEIGGITYKIEEKNAILVIKEYIKNNQDKIKKKLKEIKKEAKKKLFNYKPKDLTIKLPRAKKDNIYYPNVIYTLKEDIKDNNGEVIYPKGYKFNPLHFLRLTKRYIIFDYSDKKQVNWIKEKRYHLSFNNALLISDGNIFKAIKEFNRDIFYLNDKIIKRFSLRYTPSIVYQDGDRLVVEEIKVKDKKGKK